ncbi:uncharacterized protein GIQ15_00220 [Arthroderma uncinatum]|uniref:uncharacterized protein n=1 Tax=Arthroderma uncinatum TaxID=74035 RepID=UPI00144AAFEE|nr:uncharacterized protein GIQ15_00220 [Arthroderma uncinatum]KAF3490703.1 hypothetical protein GIQ15_00220 [Arthroderma uncinatum]
MAPGKDRLYIALYHHKREGVYHWAYLVSPKSAPDSPNRTVKYHVTNVLRPAEGTVREEWRYERLPLAEVKSPRLLARLLVGKVVSSRGELDRCLDGVPVVQDVSERAAVCYRLSSSSVTDWDVIEAESRAYVERKRDEGRFKVVMDSIPTYDLVQRREIVP